MVDLTVPWPFNLLQDAIGDATDGGAIMGKAAGAALGAAAAIYEGAIEVLEGFLWES